MVNLEDTNTSSPSLYTQNYFTGGETDFLILWLDPTAEYSTSTSNTPTVPLAPSLLQLMDRKTSMLKEMMCLNTPHRKQGNKKTPKNQKTTKDRIQAPYVVLGPPRSPAHLTG